MNYQFLKLSNIICNQKKLNIKWNEFVLSKKFNAKDMVYENL